MIPVIHYGVSAQTDEETEGLTNRGVKVVQYSFTFNFSDGWNLVTLPLYNDSYSTAEQLADAIPCNYVRKYNSSSHGWEMHERNKTENNFLLENGTGYFVYLETGKDFVTEGKEVPGVEINLKNGWNSIGWYEDNATYPEKIMEDIINSSSVSYWNATLSRFIVYSKGMEISNFSIPEGAGLFIYTETDSIWDTLPTIFSVEHDAIGVLGPDDKFNVTLKGDEEYTAKFDIESISSDIEMVEESPGVYKGSYTVGTGDPSGTYTITGHLSSDRYTDNMDAPTTVTIDTAPPATITGLTATDAGTGGTVNLAWDANADSDFAHYNIYQNTLTITDVAGMTPINNSITNNATNTYQVTGLTDGTIYYFAVTAVDDSGNENKTVNDA
ncbi:MAG: fibronectin type III domain-containing protein, partial [Thermoplasmatales archaeon]|nr:fibronectin type III domain-containing protein [Thermoplasmatales archaeon]